VISILFFFPYESDAARSFLAGSFYDWVPVEIEVYQVTKA
jgi:hypothetical protein